MEIVSVDGMLTDFEVYEVLSSQEMSRFKSVNEVASIMDRAKGASDRAAKKLKNALSRGGPTVLQDKMTKELEDIIEKNNRTYARFREQQDFTWIREYTTKYLKLRPCATQNQKAIDDFCKSLQALIKEEKFELMPHEILHLINHRPTSAVDLHVLVEEYAERMSEGAIEKLLHLCRTKLPKPPISYSGHVKEDEDAVEVDVTKKPMVQERKEEVAVGEEEEEGAIDVVNVQLGEEEDDGENLDDVIHEMARSKAQELAAREDADFNTDARAQADGDGDGRSAGGDEEDLPIMADDDGTASLSRGGRGKAPPQRKR